MKTAERTRLESRFLSLTYLFMDQIVHKHIYKHPQTNISECLNYVLYIEQ